MIKSLIIDDETDACEALKLAIEKYCPEVKVITVCKFPENGLETIQSVHPDLVFLDVQMPGMSGFDLLEQLDEINFAVIFVTAYDRYAIKAIKFSALDYLLKPVDPDDLISAVRKFKEGRHQNNHAYRYQSVLNNVKNQQANIDRLAIPDSKGIFFVETANIIYCKAEGNYSTLYLKNGKSILVSKSLKDFDHMLADSGFIRVHNASLINIKHLQKYVKGEGGYVILSDNHHVDVSRRKKEAFLQQLNKI